MATVQRGDSHDDRQASGGEILEKGSAPACVDENPPADDNDTEPKSFSKIVFVLITLALMSAIFLAALDDQPSLTWPTSQQLTRFFVAIVIPTITTDFGSIANVSWYGGAYSLTKMAFQPTFGRAYYLWKLKTVFLASIALFVIGSIISAVSPNSSVLIFGRAVQGLGSAGLFSGALTLASFAVSKKKLPLFISILSSMYAAASVLGPIIGGYVTGSHLSWRFCFWINLQTTRTSLVDKLLGFDPVGTVLLVGALTTLVLALQWGGSQLPWSSHQVLGTLIASAALVFLFAVVQVKLKERALIPVRVLKQRTVAISCVVAMLQTMAITTLTYYLPFYFQATKGLSPSQGGTYLLALAVPNSFFSIISGTAVTMAGYYVPWLMLGGSVFSVGSALLSTLNQASPVREIVGYEILASAGFGFGVQLPLVAMQNVLPRSDIPTANALYPFFQALGTTLGLATSQAIFASTLRSTLAASLPQETVQLVLDAGAAAVHTGGIPADLVALVADGYRKAVQDALYQSVASAGLTFFFSWFIEWKPMSELSEAME
ncbi:MFS general substrate transporter [Xylariaceae sp. FL1651]|nr:MFS general substrate transporter [Xylariaceae sp. FL1651]